MAAHVEQTWVARRNRENPLRASDEHWMISKEARGHGLISFRTTRNEEIVATRSKALFLTPEEFVTWLPATAAELGLHIVLDHIPKQPLVYWSGAPAELLAAWRLRLSPEKTDLRHVDPNHFIGQELGWINADVPKVKGRYLREAGTGVKSDWFVSMEEPYRENPEVIKLFDRFWRKWKKHFKYGLVTRDDDTGFERFHRDVGYSPGAEDWSRKGGILTHSFGERGEFFLPSK